MTPMKKRHHNTQQTLTGVARRALIVFAILCMSVGSAWGQITNISTGAIDQAHVGDYNQLLSSYPNNVSMPNWSSWTGRMATNNGYECWSGSGTYYEQTGAQWGANNWENHQSVNVTLPKGRYIIIGACRCSTNVNAYISVNGKQISAPAKGARGTGIDVNGNASFSGGTYANSNQGFGWEYRYIKFEVTADNTSVPIQIGGSTKDDQQNHQWMSFTMPELRKASDNTSPQGEALSTSMFKTWDGAGANAKPDENATTGCSYEFGTSTEMVYGDIGVDDNHYADLSSYEKLVLTVTAGTPRLLFNRQGDTGNDYIEINSASSKYVTVSGNDWTIDIEKIVRENGYAHLNCIKGNWANVTITSATLSGQSFTGMYHEWDGTGANANITVQHPDNFVWHVDEDVASGQVIYGESSGGVPSNQYADLSQYDNLVVTYDNTKALPRFLFNKAGDGTTITVESEGDYMTIEGNKIIIHLAKLASGNGGYAHLNCIKAPWGGSSKITSISLEHVERPVTICKTIAVGNDNSIELNGSLLCNHIPYNYIRLELVDGDGHTVSLNPAADGQNMSEANPTNAIFRVESSFGDKQNTYTNVGTGAYASASLGQWYDGLLVSSGHFTFKISETNRSNYRGSHIKIYLARYSDNSYGVNNPPEIEKTYDYTLWLVGTEPTDPSQVHQVYQENTGASSFEVNLHSLVTKNDENNILTHYEKNSFSEFDDFYLRWYVADKVTHQPIVDENGNPISLNEPVLMPYKDPNSGTDYNTMIFHEDIGMLWYLRRGWMESNSPSAELSANAAKGLVVRVDLTAYGLTQDDVEVVALTTDQYGDSGIGEDPSPIKHKYIVSFEDKNEAQYKNLPFRHYKGITGRDWEKPNGSDSPNKMTQDIWTIDGSYNNLLPTSTTNDPEKRNLVQGSKIPTNVSSVEDDIRQGVHTWEYNVYITPGDGRRALVLPFENYMYGYQTGIYASGNDLEPRAYFRWYDWDTDLAVVPEQKNYTFTACDPNILKSFTETVSGATRDRGLIALNIDPTYPTQGLVGVWLQVDDLFDDNFETNFPNGFNIACDVSKYNDGIRIFGTNAYLEHEPTLSERYIFHIFPGKKIADELADARANLSAARELLEDPALTDRDEKLALYTKLEYLGIRDGQGNYTVKPMFDLPENEGRMVVSLGAGKSGRFSLRLDETLLQNYKLWNEGKTALVDADKVKWVAFYEDVETGMVMRKQLMENTSRIQSFTYDNFTGNYYPLGSTTASETVEDGMKFHVIGYVTSGDANTLYGTGIYAPVTHYEVQFLVAPPLPVAKLKSNADNVRVDNIVRTDEYMVQHYDLQAVVDFDGNPETNKNITTEPERENYFFSKLNGSSVYDNTKNWFDAPTARENNMSWLPRKWSDIEYSYCYPQLCDYVIDSSTGYWVYNRFLSPRHGDYMILKSMNIPGISDQRQGYPYELQWWWGSQLYDYTNVYTDQSKYGSFLYTDASDESRTMITIPFEAELCGGSSIYVTAAVADMTNAETKPQLLIRIVGIDDEGNQVRVVSFHTCDISTTGASTGEWYQIYGESTIPATFDDEIKSFVCEVVNYAANTNGADFAIDQLQVYTSTAKVKLSQTEGGCNDQTNKMFIYAEAEGLQALFGRTGKTNIYWRIHDEHGEVVTKENMYDDTDPNGEHIYGMIEDLDLDYTKYLKHETSVVTEDMVKDDDNLYWFMGDDHKVYCKIAYRNLPGLLDGQTYYVSIYDPGRTLIGDFSPENNSYWGGLHTAARSKCSVFSSDFVPRQQFVIYYNNTGNESMEGGYIWMNNCDDAPVVTDMSMRLKKPDLTQPSGFVNVDADLHYDYFFGTIAQWQTDDPDETFTYNGTQYSFMDLRAAYQRYRRSDTYRTATALPSDYTDVYNGKDLGAVLRAAVAANLLELGYKTTFSNNFNTRPSKDYTVVCLAIEENIPGTEIAVCSPFVVKFDIVWHRPEMELGFSDVEYPRREGSHRIIRIGLEQLNNLRNNGYMLHIPIHDFKNKKKEGNTGTLYFDDNRLRLVETDDPTVADLSQNVLYIATLTSPHSGHEIYSDHTFVDADHMFLPLNFSGENCQVSFHEGYSYKAHTIFYDYEDVENAAAACKEDMYFTIKVVPEYVTWNPQPLGTWNDETWVPTTTTGGLPYYNVNWNNDANWNRSERAELYMDGADTHLQNTPTTWRNTVTEGGNYYYGNKYYTNAEDINGSLSSNKAFVPMKFTYVTLPEACHAPSLINMNLVAYNNSPYTGGAILAGNLITDPSPYDPERKVNSPATSDIVYDLLVRYSENTCQGHPTNGGGVYTLGGENDMVYDCEKFYGNICKEIYFKPRAELINQQRLTYEKAWVEKELEPNKWYLMSSPLKATYAGDMYVPVTMSDLSMATPTNKAGRQMTEAFQPITFSTTSQPAYSRTKYPFYQRSWDHGTGTNGSIVYTETTDPRQPYYDADLLYSGTLSTIKAEWSHAFNDVQVRYDNPLLGFAIRTKQTGTPSGTALLRLPKADMFGSNNTDWYYYNYDNVVGSVHQGVTKGNKEYGRFVTEDADGKPLNNKADISVQLVQNTSHPQNRYFLVGNPYMSSLDMAKFFNTVIDKVSLNAHLEKEWWTIDDNGNPVAGDAVAGEPTGRVKPMQAFFVKLKDDADATTPVRFINDMMVDGNDGTQPSSSRSYVMMQACSGGATSTALLEFSDSAVSDYLEGEDVETLFDSNLSDVPMVYTVAGGQAVSINQMPELKVVPFGVTCSSSEPVGVKVEASHLSSLTSLPSPLYVFDALTGVSTAVNNGETVSIQPNDYGRYFLTVHADINDNLNDNTNLIISVREQKVTVMANGNLSFVKAVNVSGATTYEQYDCGNSVQFVLQQGTYVIEAESANGKRIAKVIVK
jgi:hypothetical protein